MSDEPNKTVKDSGPAPISSTTPGAGEDLLRAGIMQQPDQPGMLGKIGRFDVIKLIGQGGMGQVLLAREPVTNVKVAIKVLKPQFARDAASVHRFLTEARHAYAMGHPNILKVMEVSDSDDRPFYVVPYIEGGSLARRLGPQKPLPADTALDIARQIAGALSYAHGRGIIHRDLKPANVLVDGEGRAYLTDFGLLRTVFNDSFVDVQQSSLEGTAPYMSPAMVQGKAEDTRCDIYSFGAMLYEMLTGQPPYTAPSIEIILKKIAAGPPEPLLKVNPKASKELAAIADWAMARELRDRYATMADVLSDLERVAKGKEPVGPRGVVGLGKPTRRNLAIAGAAVAVVAMVAFAVWQSSQRRGRVPPPSGLVAWWPGDGDANDIVGGHHGKSVNGADFAPGFIGRAFRVNGVNQYFSIPHSPRLSFENGRPYSLEAWVYRTGLRLPYHILGKRDDQSNSYFQLCGHASFDPVPQRQWTHLVLVAEAGLTRAYVNGRLDSTGTSPMNLDGANGPNTTDLRIGTSGRWAPFAGLIDDVRIYDRVLAASEILAIYEAGANGMRQPSTSSTGLSSPTVSPAAPAVAPPVPGTPPTAPVRPGIPGIPRRAARPPVMPIPAPTAAAVPPAPAVPVRPTAESPEARLAKMQAMFKGKVALRPDGRFEFFYDFSDPAQLDDWIIREPTAAWAVEGGWLVCKKNASQGNVDTRLYHKALFAGKDREIHYDAEGRDNLAAGLFAEIEDFRRQYHFRFSGGTGREGSHPPGGFSAGMSDLAVTNLGALDLKHTYHVDAAVTGDAFSFQIDDKVNLKGSIPPSNVQTGQMAYLKLAYSPGRYDNVSIVSAVDPAIKAVTYWQFFLKEADAEYAENRFDSAIGFYAAALAGMEQDPTTDATILKTMKAAALKHRGLASFIPQRDKLPADKQVEALHTKLRELNPNYSGKGQFIIRDGKIVEAWLHTVDAADLSPLQGLPLLRLVCQNNGIRDLSPLRGMPLQELNCSWNQISDLSPLKGMRLGSLNLEHESGGVTDLSPLKEMPLKWLNARGNVIKDLSPVQGMPLEYLSVRARKGVIKDLSPLQGMPLGYLDIANCPVSDLSPLRKCPLTYLDASLTEVSDLSPLAGMPITFLPIVAPKVSDLTVVKDLPRLEKLVFKAEDIKTGWEAIRRHPNLKVIDPFGDWGSSRPAAEFWKRFDAGEFTNAPRPVLPARPVEKK